MKKIMKYTTLILLVLSLVTVINGCKDKEKPEDKIIDPKTGMLFKTDSFNSTIYTISSSYMSADENIMITSLQGILAQEKAQIFVIDETDNGSSAFWLEDCKEAYGFDTVNVTDPWQLVSDFSEAIVDQKYVLFNNVNAGEVNYTDQSINYATVVAAVENYIMIPKTLETKAIEHGLVLGLDVTSDYSTSSIFDMYKDKLNTQYLVHQKPGLTYLRDYAIAGKAMTFYSDYYDGSSSIKQTILEWSDMNAPILGWTEDEVNYVQANSLLSKVTFAADLSCNLSFYSSLESEPLTQPNHTTSDITADPSKHYLAIVMSDGDNLQWMSRNFVKNENYYGSSERGQFKMTWTTSPMLYDLQPSVLSYLYDNATPNDEFIAGPSGVGYVNMTDYNPNSIGDYAAYTAGYMEKTDMEYVNLLDNYVNSDVLDSLSGYDQIKGGVWSIGNKYIEGNGGIYWSNDKPFVAVRETLWRIDGNNISNKYYGYVERVAQRINEYKVDPASIEGYTVLVAHAWSIGSMGYISRFVSELDDDVELVTVSELLTLVENNVAHVDQAKVNDITPDYFDNNLAPISSDQYLDAYLDALTTDTKKSFIFDSAESLGNWQLGCGGLQYDSAVLDGNHIRLDGSDLNDVLDPLPNAWVVNKFDISSDSNEDNYFKMIISSGDNADTNVRLRVIYFDGTDWISNVLVSDNYDTPVNEFGYYLLNEGSPSSFIFDITTYKGKSVIFSIEQDDSGEGSGEIVNISKISIIGKEVNISTRTSWEISNIIDEWSTFGRVVTHPEGVCLENQGKDASILVNTTITEDTDILRIHVRKFVRTGTAQDLDAKIIIKVNGEIVKAQYSEQDYVTVTTDYFRGFDYDLSAYIGQTVSIEIINIEGEHACFNLIELLS